MEHSSNGSSRICTDKSKKALNLINEYRSSNNFNENKMGLLHEELTDRIIKSFYDVYNELGYGFLEKVYENALLYELQQNNIYCERQRPIQVFYKDQKVGDYFSDIVVENIVILELKAAEGIAVEHECQLINYLRATEMEVGLLLNFGKSAQFKRKIFTNDKKRINRNK